MDVEETASVSKNKRKRGRLTRSADFDRVYREGTSRANRYVVMYVFDRRDGSEGIDPRLGISVSRKVGGAVERNRVKRMLREAFWSLKSEDKAVSDYVLIARSDICKLVEKEGLEGIKESISSILDEVNEVEVS